MSNNRQSATEILFIDRMTVECSRDCQSAGASQWWDRDWKICSFVRTCSWWVEALCVTPLTVEKKLCGGSWWLHFCIPHSHQEVLHLSSVLLPIFHNYIDNEGKYFPTSRVSGRINRNFLIHSEKCRLPSWDWFSSEKFTISALLVELLDFVLQIGANFRNVYRSNNTKLENFPRKKLISDGSLDSQGKNVGW